MLYEELIMDPSTLIKFDLFKKIIRLNDEHYPVTQLAEEMDLNYQQTMIDLAEIDKDLVEIHPDHPSMLIGAGKVNSFKITTTIDEYRYFLLQQSVPFQFMIYFLNEPNPNINKFCEEFFVSRSTVSRKIINLRAYLHQFHLRLTYTEAGLVGDERIIRIALFILVWLGTRGMYWPLSVSEEKAEELAQAYAEYFPLSRTYLGRLELKFFAGIFLSRFAKNKFVKYDKRYDFLLKKNTYYDPQKITELIDFPLTARQIKGESGFIAFLAHFAPFYTIEEDSSLLQTLEDFSTRPNPVYDLTTKFLDYVRAHFFEAEPELLESPLIFGNLLNVGFSFYVLRQVYPSIHGLVVQPQMQAHSSEEFQDKITQFFHSIKTEQSFSFITDEVLPEISKMYASILLPYYDRVKYSEKLQVSLAMEHNFLLVKGLYQFLDDLKFVEAEPYNHAKSQDYDLIISSSLLLKQDQPNLPVYFWDHSSSETELISLYQELRQLYTEKNFE
ncbi:M protein trans-acting positive regulator [Enterococcus sp. JM4C]|uniref:helix-turn-helix domain-containing protein n=1 Tax=Candidatus Enterococcus huntleyi TaxID=1857217 RepID=UPI00137B526C|nr:helix-turn-helix domain-containing protein [Enterococcus sp. JM4C]KAF1299130.1 M protein trans-acting positive regulator [Enterococcus sp. JM4C]